MKILPIQKEVNSVDNHQEVAECLEKEGETQEEIPANQEGDINTAHRIIATIKIFSPNFQVNFLQNLMVLQSILNT